MRQLLGILCLLFAIVATPLFASAQVPAKETAGEHIHDYSPSATYTVTVATSVPLDILLEPGEQVRNVIGGDREPATEETQTRRWVVKEGGDGAGEGLRHHIFVSVTEPGL